MVKQDKPRYITATEAAEILGLSPQTLANQRFRRVGLVYHRFGRAIRYDLRDILQYAESHRIDPQEAQSR
jgi:hypothetical protein